jgi:two-component system, sensor histidine kinase
MQMMNFVDRDGRDKNSAEAEGAGQRIEKLTKINRVLMRRAERAMGQPENAASLFQTVMALGSEAKARTEELKTVLAELERSNLELKHARDVAERANRTKTGFFTAVGHDVLQPLQAARLTLSALAEMEDGQPGQPLVTQVDQALSIVEDLLRTILDLSRLETGALRPNVQPVDLNEVFNSVVGGLLPLAVDKGISLRFRKTGFWVMSDPQMLRRIVQNLAANAVRYTEAGHVLICARPRGRDVCIAVYDTGPGIAAQERELIFQEFERGEASERGGTHGFGLGLSIVRRMSAALKHEIFLRSVEGRGSCFGLRAVRATPARQPRGAVPSPLPQVNLSARVVIVENDKSVAAGMVTLLRQWGCETKAVRNFSEASDLAGGPAPDIVLADYHLDNGETGLKSVRLLRKVFGAKLPVVVLTADRTHEVAAAVQEARCEFMLKPVKPAELRSLIAHLLRKT